MVDGVDRRVGAVALRLGGERRDEQAGDERAAAGDERHGPGAGEAAARQAATLPDGRRGLVAAETDEQPPGGAAEAPVEDDGARAGDEAELTEPDPSVRDELAAATGLDDPVAGARALLDEGASAVVVSLGADGMLLLLAGRPIRWTAAPARVLSGNPTGAGDAAVAAFAAGLDEGAAADAVGRAEALVQSLPKAVALSGAAVLSPVAGEIDLNTYREMLSRITVTEDEHAD